MKKQGGDEGLSEWERGNVGQRVLGVDRVIPCIAETFMRWNRKHAQRAAAKC